MIAPDMTGMPLGHLLKWQQIVMPYIGDDGPKQGAGEARKRWRKWTQSAAGKRSRQDYELRSWVYEMPWNATFERAPHVDGIPRHQQNKG